MNSEWNPHETTISDGTTPEALTDQQLEARQFHRLGSRDGTFHQVW